MQKDRDEELAFRIYVTDTLMLQAEGKYIKERYIDFVNPEKLEDFDAQEVIEGVIARAGLEVTE